MQHTHAKTIQLKAWRGARGLSQQAIADAIGRDKSVVSKMERGLCGVTGANLVRMAEALHTTADSLFLPPPEGTRPVTPADAGQAGGVRIAHPHAAADTEPPLDMTDTVLVDPALGAARKSWPLNVPIMGTAAGSLGEGAFQLDLDGPVDYARRPPGIATARNAYAIYVVGDSMSPRYEDGDPVFVHPDKPARPGDYVVVQMQNHETDRVQAYIKRLKRRTQTTLHLEQFNPTATIELPMDKVRAIHKVLEPADLFGL